MIGYRNTTYSINQLNQPFHINLNIFINLDIKHILNRHNSHLSTSSSIGCIKLGIITSLVISFRSR